MAIVSSAVLLGLQYALLALGVYITFRVLNIPDLTVDGGFTFGAAVSALLSIAGHPFLGLLAALASGAAAGIVTGFLQTKAGIHPILAGILTMSGLYTVNITIMGAPNLSLIGKPRFYEFLYKLMPDADKDLMKILAVFVICAGLCILLILFFRTVFGLCIRATGNNEDMVRASSINTNMKSHGARDCQRARGAFWRFNRTDQRLRGRQRRQRHDCRGTCVCHYRRSDFRQALAVVRAYFRDCRVGCLPFDYCAGFGNQYFLRQCA